MANRWGNNENSNRVYFLGLQNHCRWWLHPWNLKMLAPWKKSYDKPRQCIKKQRHPFTDKGPYSQSYGFSSSHVRVGLTIKKAACWKIDAFELWCWRRLLRVPSTAMRSNQSILIEINPEYLLEGLMLKVNLPYLGHLMRRADLLEKILMQGKIEVRRRGRKRMRMLAWHGIIDSMGMSSSKLWEMVKDREAWHPVVHGVIKSRTQLSDWTTFLSPLDTKL